MRGKSMLLHTIITSFMLNYTPKQLKFILIDPKQVELSIYSKSAYLKCDVISSLEDIDVCFDYIIFLMNTRYSIFANANVQNIDEYNKINPNYALEKIVVVIDELADISLNNPKLLDKLCIIAQKSRACGIHLIVATQRPSADVINGTIKQNFIYRIGLKCASSIDSRTILDVKGAEKLLGQGDLLLKTPISDELIRVQAPYISREYILKCLQNLKYYTDLHNNYFLDELENFKKSHKTNNTINTKLINSIVKELLKG